MKKSVFLLPVGLLSLLIAFPALATDAKSSQNPREISTETSKNIPSLQELNLPATSAKLLTEPTPNSVINNTLRQQVAQVEATDDDDVDFELEAVGEKETLPESTPTYIINKEEIQKQGAASVADVLKKMPGFSVNDVGPGADIHTGTYYRGASINQSVFLLNGRPINNNVNTYHGATDLNSIPVEAIERVELYSGAGSTLYGSSAFGGVVNIITKQGEGKPKFNGSVEFGSLNTNNQQASYSGASGNVRYNLSFEHFFTDNRYKVPVGAANRGTDGYLFNADTETSSYFGNVAVDLDKKNTVSFDAKKLASRRGLVYFGFPLQKDRLDHDGLNVGLSWKSQLPQGSNLTATLGYNQDYFSTYGPTFFRGTEYYRTASLDAKTFSARVDHEWKLAPNNTLRWGFDVKNDQFDGEQNSTRPDRVADNGITEKSLLNTALFAVNTLNLTDNFQVDLGLRQNFDGKFGSYLNPSVGFRYEMSPSVALRGNWASTQRNPGLDQLYFFDTVHGWDSNPNLKPETGSAWTAGVDVNLSSNLTGQFTYFGSSLDNRLATVNPNASSLDPEAIAPIVNQCPNSVQRRTSCWFNVGHVKTNGFEAGLNWKFAPGWSSFANYTYTDAKITSSVSPTEVGLQLGMIPYSIASVGIGYEKDGWQANLYGTYYSGARRSVFALATDKPTDFSPSYFNLDFNARVPVSKNLGVTVNLENLLGEQYERVNRIYSPGFTFRVGLNANF